MKKTIYFCALVAACALLGACGKGGVTLFSGSDRKAVTSSQELQFAAPHEDDTVAVITTSLGEIRAVLYPQYAPMAVENFIGLAQQGYFNGLPFHRVLKDFLVQSGDATGTGTGGATIWNNTPYPVELSDKLHHYSGAMGIAHEDGNVAGNMSQFYIVQTPQKSVDKSAAETLQSMSLRQAVVDTYRAAGGAPYLDNLYTVFGQVYVGMDVVDAIGQVACDENGQPVAPVTIQSVQITTYSAAAAADAAASGTAASAASTASSQPAAAS